MLFFLKKCIFLWINLTLNMIFLKNSTFCQLFLPLLYLGNLCGFCFRWIVAMFWLLIVSTLSADFSKPCCYVKPLSLCSDCGLFHGLFCLLVQSYHFLEVAVSRYYVKSLLACSATQKDLWNIIPNFGSYYVPTFSLKCGFSYKILLGRKVIYADLFSYKSLCLLPRFYLERPIR